MRGFLKDFLHEHELVDSWRTLFWVGGLESP